MVTIRVVSIKFCSWARLEGSPQSWWHLCRREDWDFFSHLEMHMRQEQPPLAGRDHLAFRSFYFPVKDVIDGDLCEQYPTVRRPYWSLLTCSGHF